MKFNDKAHDSTKTYNYEGGVAYRVDRKTELMLRAVSTLVGENKFYTSGKNIDTELVKLIHEVCRFDPEFVLKLAAYCRSVLHLRSVPLLLLAEYANCEHDDIPNTRRYVRDCIKRVDDMTELVSYQFGKYPRSKAKLPMVLKYGLASAFGKFDEYQFAKYNRDGKVKLKDVLFLTHPQPTDLYQYELFGKIASDTLKVPDTWEVVISRNDGRDMAKKWEEILPKMGYMALLRNLSNLLRNRVNMSDALSRIKDPLSVRSSKQMPYRFYSAYREVNNLTAEEADVWSVKNTLIALEDALMSSIENIPKLPGRTLIAVDTSGSMDSRLSNKSTITYFDIATLYGSIASKICEESIVCSFDSIFQVIQDPSRINPLHHKDMFTLGGATYAHLVPQWMLDTQLKVDRIIFFSDFQVYNKQVFAPEKGLSHLMKEYRNKINKDVYLYSIDLAGYGTTAFQRDIPRTTLIGGWSDRVFDLISLHERGNLTMIEEINSYSPPVGRR